MWLGKPVDVVASLGTHGSRVFVSRERGAFCDQIAGAYEALVGCDAHLATRDARFVKSKVLSFCFSVFVICKNSIFPILHLLIFRVG